LAFKYIFCILIKLQNYFKRAKDAMKSVYDFSFVRSLSLSRSVSFSPTHASDKWHC